MNVFEDLIVELKHENLLETTVIDDDIANGALITEPADEIITSDFEISANGSRNGHVLYVDETSETKAEPEADANVVDDITEEPVAKAADAAAAVKPGKEFFKKRAVGEVSSLQMVEHIITAVEREYIKTMPAVFDDLDVKKALHTFVQSLDSEKQADQATAEFALMHETEAWCSALGRRDKNIPVASLRHYCETARPALSSQALLAIAKFYRNLPYSEPVRSKFDFVMTRLFTHTVENERRSCLLDRLGTLNQINTLYSEWSSVPLYSADDDENRIMLAALSLDDLAREAESASSFDQLIASDFFGRVRLFKESISEVFLAPEVIAAAIEANVRMGNAYIALLAQERERMDADSIASKYAALDHGAISEAAGRTLELMELLRTPLPSAKDSADSSKPTFTETLRFTTVGDNKTKGRASNTFLGKITGSFLGMSRWVIVFCSVMIAIGAGIWIWSDYAEERIPTTGVVAVDLSGNPAAEYVRNTKVSNNTLYAQVQPSWDGLSKEKRQEALQRLYQAGGDKAYSKVNLIGKGGRTVAYAAADKLEVAMP